MLETLRVLQRRFVEVTADQKSNFFGLLRDEFDHQLTTLRDELDEQVVLALVASSEATLRFDFENRVRLRTKDKMRRRFQELRDRYEERVQLEDILDAWKDETSEVERIGRFKQLVKRRHWLAHGRYWSDKSGVAPDPVQVHVIVEDLFNTLRDALGEFPLSLRN